MHRNLLTIAAVATALVILCPRAEAQRGQPPEAAELGTRLEEMISAMLQYVGDYRLVEADLQALERSRARLPAAPDSGDAEDEGSLRGPDGTWDFDALLDDPDVRRWLRASGFDGHRLVRAALRAALIQMWRQTRSAPDPGEGLEEQLRQLEAVRSQLGEAGYREAVAAVRQALELRRRLLAAVEKVPPPTDVELELLDRYADLFADDEGEDASDDW